MNAAPRQPGTPAAVDAAARLGRLSPRLREEALALAGVATAADATDEERRAAASTVIAALYPDPGDDGTWAEEEEDATRGDAGGDAIPTPPGLSARHAARWANAVRWARKVNALLARGCLVFIRDEDGYDRPIPSPVVVGEGRIYDREEFPGGGSSSTIFFVADPDIDCGLHKEIPAWNAGHRIVYYEPAACEATW